MVWNDLLKKKIPLGWEVKTLSELLKKNTQSFDYSSVQPTIDLTSRLLGYFTKILQKNCREFFPTIAYKKEVRYYSNFLFRFNYKSISRQSVKHAVTGYRRYFEVSKGNSTSIRRNRNSKRVPRRYRFPRPAQRSSYRFYRYLREQNCRKQWIF